MDELAKMVTNVGFPIAISIYLLVRFESKLEVLTNSINNLSAKISVMSNSHDDDHKAA